MDTVKLQQLLSELANLRREAENKGEEAKALKMVYEQSDAFKKFETAKNEAGELGAKVESLTAIIKQLAHDEGKAEEFVNRRPVLGVQFKDFSIVSITDEKAAKVWAANNAPSIISISDSKLKKAVENLELPFVEKSTEVRVELASDLSAYIEG